MEIQDALAMAALALDGAPCEQHRAQTFAVIPGIKTRLLANAVKASEADDGTRNALFMLLALVMDLWRKNEYVYMALAPFLDDARRLSAADRRRAAQIAAHAELLFEHEQEEPVKWEERADDALALVHILLNTGEMGLRGGTEQHHMHALERLAGRERIEREKAAVKKKLEEYRRNEEESESTAAPAERFLEEPITAGESALGEKTDRHPPSSRRATVSENPMEQRLVIWSGIPDGSLLEVRVEPGDYTAEGHGRLKELTGATLIDVGTAELVDRPLVVTISRRSTLRLLILLTYIMPLPTEAVIRARVLTPDGEPVTSTEGIEIEPFVGTYQGQAGGDNFEDELVLLVAGEQ
jgi:hypothetical protein